MYHVFQALRDNADLIAYRRYNDFTVIEMDAQKVRFQGRTLREYGARGRRKWENLFFLENPYEKLKFQYLNA